MVRVDDQGVAQQRRATGCGLSGVGERPDGQSLRADYAVLAGGRWARVLPGTVP